MRTYSIHLAQNLGTDKLGTSLDVTSARVDVGSWQWEADKELTKVTHGDITIRLADLDGSIWGWISTQTKNGADLLPPWLTIDIDGRREFTGTINPSQMSVDRDGEISITAQGWSSQLSDKTLGAIRAEDDLNDTLNPWLRPSPRCVADRPTWSHVCVLEYSQVFPSPPYNGGIRWQGLDWLSVGDVVTTPEFPGKEFKISVIDRIVGVPGDWRRAMLGAEFGQLVLEKFGPYTGTEPTGLIECKAGQPQARPFYVVTKIAPESPSYKIYLDTVDGIAPGDGLQTLNTAKGQAWSMLQIDAESKYVVTREEVKDLAVHDRVFFTDESRSQLVFEDARAAIARAAAPFAVDFSRFSMPTLPVPVLVWLPLRPLIGEDLTSLKDLDVGMSNLRAFGSDSAAWDGTPEAGWASASASLPRAPWTSQRLTPPTSLMPDQSTTKAPRMPSRNRVQSLRYRMKTTDQTDDPTWDPAAAEITPSFLVHDYLSMRRLLIKQGGVVEIEPWDGNAWGAMTQCLWQGTAIKSASVLPGLPGALLTYCWEGLELASAFPGPVTASCQAPAEAADAVLVTTPWAAYLVGSKGYGRVGYANGILSLDWVQPLDKTLGSLFPTSFAGLDEESVVVLGRFDLKDPSDPSKISTETWMLRLKAAPSATDAPGSVLWSERVLEGAPILCGAMRDSSQADRVIGHCGGRMFQVAKQLPAAYALERFRPTGMKAAELIEHAAQVLCALVISTPDGVMHLVSRQDASEPIALTIPACDVAEALDWEHRYTMVRVAGSGEDIYRDVPSVGEPSIKGGKTLEFSGHPFIWTMSGCEAMARIYHAWFSPIRRYQGRKWIHPDPSTPAPWESLPPAARVRINGEATIWRVMALDDKRTEGEARVKLLEVW